MTTPSEAAHRSSSPRESWFHERESAWLYRRVSAAEPDPRKRALFDALAQAAEHQAHEWVAQLGTEPAFRPSPRARVVAALLPRLGPERLRPILVAMKLRGLSVYSAPPPAAGHAMPTSVEQIGARHRGFGGGNLRAAVFGVNDGLLSNASLILGVAGAGVDARFVLTSGVAGLLAGALSMAAGEYVSVSSQEDAELADIRMERKALEQHPEAELEELTQIYIGRGLEPALARQVAEQLTAHDVLAAHLRDEVGIHDLQRARPVQAALASAASFTIGALPPVLLAWLWTAPGLSAVIVASTLVLLAVLGYVAERVAGGGGMKGALRVLLWGTLALAVTAGIGRIFGVSAG